MLCITPSLVGLALIFERISWWTLLSGSTPSLPPQRGRLLTAVGFRDTSFSVHHENVYIRKVQYASLVLSSATNELRLRARIQETSGFRDTSSQYIMKCDGSGTPMSYCQAPRTCHVSESRSFDKEKTYVLSALYVSSAVCDVYVRKDLCAMSCQVSRQCSEAFFRA